jgi:hypothetical protein
MTHPQYAATPDALLWRQRKERDIGNSFGEAVDYFITEVDEMKHCLQEFDSLMQG